MNNIPEDVVRENILPFTYHIQDPDLRKDIRNYHKTIERVENYYYTNSTEQVLYKDIITFCNLHSIDGKNYGIDIEKLFERRFSSMLLRMKKKRTHCPLFKLKLQLMKVLQTDPDFIVQNNADNEVCFFLSYCYRNNTKRFIHFLWGLMTSYERTRFVDKYVPKEE